MMCVFMYMYLYAHVDAHVWGVTGQLWGINILLWAGLTQQALLPEEPSCWSAVSPFLLQIIQKKHSLDRNPFWF